MFHVKHNFKLQSVVVAYRAKTSFRAEKNVNNLPGRRNRLPHPWTVSATGHPKRQMFTASETERLVYNGRVSLETKLHVPRETLC